MTVEKIDIVFDGPPGPAAGRFVEVENSEGKSIRFGEWIRRPDGYWVLRIPAPGSQFYENAHYYKQQLDREAHKLNEWIDFLRDLIDDMETDHPGAIDNARCQLELARTELHDLVTS